MKLILIAILILFLISCGSKHDQAQINEMWDVYNKLKKINFNKKNIEDVLSDLKILKSHSAEFTLKEDHQVVKLIRQIEKKIVERKKDIKIVKKVIKELNEEKVENILEKYQANLKPELYSPDNYEIDIDLIKYNEKNPGKLKKYPKLLAHVNLILTIEAVPDGIKQVGNSLHGTVTIKNKSTISKCGLAIIGARLLGSCKTNKIDSLICWIYEDGITQLMDTNKKHYLMYLNITKGDDGHHLESKFNDKGIKNIFKDWGQK